MNHYPDYPTMDHQEVVISRIFGRYHLWDNEELLETIIVGSWALSGQDKEARERGFENIADAIQYNEPSFLITGGEVSKVFEFLLKRQLHPQNPLRCWKAVCEAYLAADAAFERQDPDEHDHDDHLIVLEALRRDEIAATHGDDVADSLRYCVAREVAEKWSGRSRHRQHKGACKSRRTADVDVVIVEVERDASGHDG
ncbi:MAG: hypothetical protein Q9217_002032 [Psora testacea]